MDHQINEKWSKIEGFNGRYSISNLGNIKSHPVHIPYLRKDGKEMTIFIKGRTLKKSITKAGYERVCLCNINGEKQYAIHRLVAKAFKLNKFNKPQVNHKNGIKTDNRASNLEWCTASENQLHAFRVLKKKPNKTGTGKFNELHACSKVVLQIDINTLVVIKEWSCCAEAHRALNISRGNISTVARGKSYNKTAGGFIWKYK